MADIEYAINLNVFTTSHEGVARATEVMARAVAGLALEGLHATMSAHILPDDEDSG